MVPISRGNSKNNFHLVTLCNINCVMLRTLAEVGTWCNCHYLTAQTRRNSMFCHCLIRSLRFLHLPALALCEGKKTKKSILLVTVWPALIQIALSDRSRNGQRSFDQNSVKIIEMICVNHTKLAPSVTDFILHVPSILAFKVVYCLIHDPAIDLRWHLSHQNGLA